MTTSDDTRLPWPYYAPDLRAALLDLSNTYNLDTIVDAAVELRFRRDDPTAAARRELELLRTDRRRR